jgi:hypothetical protein
LDVFAISLALAKKVHFSHVHPRLRLLRLVVFSLREVDDCVTEDIVVRVLLPADGVNTRTKTTWRMRMRLAHAHIIVILWEHFVVVHERNLVLVHERNLVVVHERNLVVVHERNLVLNAVSFACSSRAAAKHTAKNANLKKPRASYYSGATADAELPFRISAKRAFHNGRPINDD